MTGPTPSPSYSNLFEGRAVAHEYDHGEYASGSYSSHIWNLQRPIVMDLIRREQGRGASHQDLLDFACGTGRVLLALESLFTHSEGVDISHAMIELARSKCRRSALHTGDATGDLGLLREKYDVVTAFRFLLNAEPELRLTALRRIRTVIREPDGLLLVNMHGNSRSVRHPSILLRRCFGLARGGAQLLNEMSPRAVRSLISTAGFRIVHQIGFGVLPRALYNTPLRPVAARIDQVISARRWTRNFSIDLLFVCKPC